MITTRALFPALALLAATGCAPAAATAPQSGSEPPAGTVFAVSHGWHTGLALRADDAESLALADLTGAGYVEFGWGDRAFYQADNPTLSMALRPLLWPTEAVLHVVALPGPPAQVLAGTEVVELAVTRAELGRLVEFVVMAFARDAAGHPIALGAGLYGRSRFYLAAERYHALRTCNTWTARALEAAGCPSPGGPALTASGVMRQARACAR